MQIAGFLMTRLIKVVGVVVIVFVCGGVGVQVCADMLIWCLETAFYGVSLCDSLFPSLNA